MKRGLIISSFFLIVIVIFVYSFGVASAANTCSSQDQIIFKISGDTNAHAEVYDGARGYGTEICYEKIFSNAPVGADRNCVNSNEVVRLSGNTNAHAEGPDVKSAGYSDVCFRDLQCTLRESCLAGEKEVIRLSGNTNAHLEIGNGNIYGNVLCCTSASAPGVGCDPACTNDEICVDGNCVSPPSSPKCGNGKREPASGEACDGNDFPDGVKTCRNLGYSSGNLACTSDCRIDTSGCTGQGSMCGNENIDEGEQCDGNNIPEACENLGYAPGSLACHPQGNPLECKYDETSCDVKSCNSDGKKDSGEQCDGTDFGKETCGSLVAGTSGNLGCQSCVIDTSGCTGQGSMCGNENIDAGEQCDGNNIPETCENLGYAPGSLACHPKGNPLECKYDETSCDVKSCDDDGKKDLGEQCDGNDFGKETCGSLVSGTTGNLGCKSCVIDTSECSSSELRAYWAYTDTPNIPVKYNEGFIPGNYIALVVKGAKNGEKISLTIKDDDLLNDDLIRTESTIADEKGEAIKIIQFSRNDFAKGVENTEGDDLELYFKAEGDKGYNKISENQILLSDEAEIVPPIEGCAKLKEENACKNAGKGVWGIDEIKYEKENTNFPGCGKIDDKGNTIKCQCIWKTNDGDSQDCEFYWEISIPDSGPEPVTCNGRCEMAAIVGECNLETNTKTTTSNNEWINLVGGECDIKLTEYRDQCEKIEVKNVLCGAPSLILPFFGEMQFLISIFAFVIVYVFLILRSSLSGRKETKGGI